MSTTTTTPLERAESYAAEGLSVIPIRTDGSKAPPLKWAAYQATAPTTNELRAMFGQGEHGIAIVCGTVSHLEVIDFDADLVFEWWRETVEQERPGLID